MNKKIKIIIIIALVLIIIDQVSKVLVSNLLSDGRTIGNDNSISLVITNNTGMAFGFNQGNISNVIITIFVLCIIFSFIKNQIEQIDKKTIVAVSFVMAGGISNLIDRFVRGSVLDFIKIFKFPVFNLADVFIVSGWILIILFLVIYTRKNRGVNVAK